jgi:hypothetical protein
VILHQNRASERSWATSATIGVAIAAPRRFRAIHARGSEPFAGALFRQAPSVGKDTWLLKDRKINLADRWLAALTTAVTCVELWNVVGSLASSRRTMAIEVGTEMREKPVPGDLRSWDRTAAIFWLQSIRRHGEVAG